MSYECTSCRCPVCDSPAEYNCETEQVFCEYCQRVARYKENQRVEKIAADERVSEFARLKAQEEFKRRGQR
jgi:hypothetical protein